MNSWIRGFLILSLLLSSATETWSSVEEERIKAQSDTTAMEIRIDNKHSSMPQNRIHVEIPSVSNAQEAADLINDKIRNTSMPVLITTDRPDFVAELAQNASREPQKKNVYLAPYGEVLHPKAIPKWRQAFNTYWDNIVTAAKNDRIGLMVMIGTIGYEHYLWFNVTNLSTLAQTSNFLYSVLLIGTFGIDKNGWSRATKPVQKFFKTITGHKGIEWDRKDPRDIANRFAASLVLSMGLNTIRYGLVSMDQMLQGALDLSGMKIQALIAVATTVSSFAWAEHIALVDQKTSPTARFFFSRVQESRALMLGFLAATWNLLHPETYGFLPWVTLSISGAVGITVYWNAEKIRDWIEHNRAIRKVMTKISGIKWLFPEDQGLMINYCRLVHIL